MFRLRNYGLFRILLTIFYLYAVCDEFALFFSSSWLLYFFIIFSRSTDIVDSFDFFNFGAEPF